MIVLPFPAPPATVEDALRVVAVLTRGSAQEQAALAGTGAPQLPWDPGTCSDEVLRADLWCWCELVAVWLNREHAWRPQQMIPLCWPRHPHIARELPLLAVLRWQAQTTLDPQLLEDWQRYALPGFSSRMFERLGDSTCRAGRHQDWPGASRHAAHTDPAASRDRHQLFRLSLSSLLCKSCCGLDHLVVGRS